MKLLHQDLTENIIAAFFEVYNNLGYGFLERVYERSMLHELGLRGMFTRSQQPIKVYYKGQITGDFVADIIVENKVIVEIKAASLLAIEHDKQLQNYLRATDIEVGLLLNFGPKPQLLRRVLTNENKEVRI